MEAILSASQKGRALYHEIWRLTKDHFFDATRLADWQSFEHRFDEQIDSEESALAFAQQALATLNDTYTTLIVRQTAAGQGTAPAADAPANVMAVVTKKNLGYIRILDFDDEDVVDQVEAALRKLAGCDGIMLDLRANGGGSMDRAAKISQFFIDRGTIVTFESRTEGGIKKRRAFVEGHVFGWTDTLPDGGETTEKFQRLDAIVAGKPLAVLLSGRTASAAELLAAAVICNNYKGLCTSVGRVTAGKGIGQRFFELPGTDVQLRVSYCRFIAPEGTWFGDCGQTEANGIDPEIPVPEDKGTEALEVAADAVRKMFVDLQAEAN